MERQAIPGAMKLPPGAKDREKFQLLEARVQGLEKSFKDATAAASTLLERVAALETKLADKQDPEPDKAILVARAHELGLGAPSQLARWSIEKLQTAITEAKG